MVTGSYYFHLSYRMRLHIEKRVLIGFLVTIVVLGVLGVFSVTSTQRLIDTERLLDHTTHVINTGELVAKSVIDIETGQRGFVITGNENFLSPYYEASQNLNTYLNSLDSLTKQSPSQQARITEVRAIISQQLKWTASVIETRKTDFEKSRAIISIGEGKKRTDAIRDIVKNIQLEERKVFEEGNAISVSNLKRLQDSLTGMAVAVLLIIIYLFYAIYKTLKQHDEAEQQLKNIANETRDLYDNAPCGYLSVNSNIFLSNMNQTLLDWMGYTREEVIDRMKFEDLLSPESRAAFLQNFERNFEKFKQNGTISDLEFEFQRKNGTTFSALINSTAIFNEHGEFIKSRSTAIDNTERKKAENKIKMLNRELEAFTYSVSHDLRAPLRSIAGYTQILEEDYGNKLGGDGMRVTQIITNNSKRMGQLIDELVDFSQVGRRELSHVDLNMNELVQGITHELKTNSGDRKINIRQLPLKPSKGDSGMVRQVWVNLISNALKYSRNKEVTEIEIGSFDKEEQTCYYIRDNGAGFDMQYVNKLFGVFQRLHKMTEFEGSGVGLALVRTIIKRHGGYVWGEGKVDEGATFYFTLPNTEQIEV